MITLEEFTRIRAEQAGQKYIMASGENQATYRDNTLDILEKLSDAYHILGLLIERTELPQAKTSPYMFARAALLYAFDDILTLRKTLPAALLADDIPVERHVRLDRQGKRIVEETA